MLWGEERHPASHTLFLQPLVNQGPQLFELALGKGAFSEQPGHEELGGVVEKFPCHLSKSAVLNLFLFDQGEVPVGFSVGIMPNITLLFRTPKNGENCLIGEAVL